MTASVRGLTLIVSWLRALVFVTVCTIVGVSVWWFESNARHLAVTSLEFDPRSISQSGGISEARQALATREYLATQAVIITSRAVCRRAAEAVMSLPGGHAPQSPRERERVAGRLCDRLSTRRIGDSLVMELSYADDDPRRATTFTDAVAEAYVHRALTMRAGMNQPTAAHWTQELAGAESALTHSEQALATFTQQHQIAALDPEQALVASALNAYSAALTAVRIRRVQVSAKLAQLEALSKDGIPPTHVSDATFGQLRSRIKELEAEHHGLTLSSGNEHPQLPALRARLANARAQLEEATRDALAVARSEVAGAEREEREFQKKLDEAHATALKLAALQVEFTHLKRAETRDEVLRSAILGKISKAGLAPDAEGWVVRVLSRSRTIDRGSILPFALALCVLAGAASFVAWSPPRGAEPRGPAT